MVRSCQSGRRFIDPRGRVGQITTWLGGDRYEVRHPDDLIAEWMGNSLLLQKVETGACRTAETTHKLALGRATTPRKRPSR